ncbi:LADA_0G02388g1_1 [Lachancea dasiensis]|uniref:LADA_0G02388g1_1 n=1 Tax=Lachancea dasiensis TaxID=1072105 RepID=A0A1G4JRE6_9SACH|nr:LADA_0G02388g1_1 [Lachancea dasiensis]
MSFEEPRPLESGDTASLAPPALEGAPVEETNVLPADEEAFDEGEPEVEDGESLYSHEEERDVAEKEDSATPEVQTAPNEDASEGLVDSGSAETSAFVPATDRDEVEIADAANQDFEKEAADAGAATEDSPDSAKETVEDTEGLPQQKNYGPQDSSEANEPGSTEDATPAEVIQNTVSENVEVEPRNQVGEVDVGATLEQDWPEHANEEPTIVPGHSEQPKPFDVNNFTNGDRQEDVDYDLLQRQATVILQSHLLELPQFQRLSDSEKLNAVITFLDSSSETALPSKSLAAAPQAQMAQEAAGRPNLLQPMSPAERKRYNEYLRGENRITEIQNIPPKSRLFIGNLPLKNVAKDDLFRIFSPYGHIYQINIKNAFGFIQYDNPQSVRAAIAGESNEMNFGKKLILEISSSNSRPQYDHGDHGTNSSSTFISSSKRPFDEDEEEEDMYSESQKRGKRRVPECQIFVKRTADRSYATEVFNRFRQGSGLETDMIFLKPRMELRKMINDAAYDGVLGVVLVNKTRNVDIQTFYKGSQGETKFDEYASVSCEDALAIFNNLKGSRNGHMNMPPQHVPQQQYYGGYNVPAPAAPPHQGQAYMQQAYGAMAPPPQAYGAPAPPPPQMSQGYSGYPGHPIQAPPPTHISPTPAAVPPMGATPQVDQQQLFSAIQNLPPNIVANLLSMAQQQPQQQHQLLGIIQSMQPQGTPAQGPVPGPGTYTGFQPIPPQPTSNSPQPGPNISQAVPHQQAHIQPGSFVPSPKNPPAQNPVPQQQSPSMSGNNNVQSLLDSLAQLQQR